MTQPTKNKIIDSLSAKNKTTLPNSHAPSTDDTPPALTIENISVEFTHQNGTIYALDDVSLTLKQGEILVLLGESGCGKSVLCKAAMGLLPERGHITGGRIVLHPRQSQSTTIDITVASEKELQQLRGHRISMMFQHPLTILNPSMTIGAQLFEALRQGNTKNRREGLHPSFSTKKPNGPSHHDQTTSTKETLTIEALHLLEAVGLPGEKKWLHMMPHELSGGQRQRCALAIALAMKPDILLADEPTTALDVTVQIQVLDVLKKLRHDLGLSLIVITHDLGVAAYMADRIAVMYGGRIVEIGTAEDILCHPRHPYTWGLLRSVPAKADKGHPLHSITGHPPLLTQRTVGDPFAPRNPYAMAIDYHERPPLFVISPTHRAATWLLDSRAPKVTPPIICAGEKLAETTPASKKQIRSDTHATISTTDAAPLAEKNNNSSLNNPIAKPLLKVTGLSKTFITAHTMTIPAVTDVSFTLHAGEIVGLVGESGCGKSTLARLIMGRYRSDCGTMFFDGRPIITSPSQLHHDLHPCYIQLIFQDSDGALHPQRTVAESIDEALRLTHANLTTKERRLRVNELLSMVQLDPHYGTAYPSELSGGQRQRVAIARALAVQPRLIIADEAVAALDMSVQAQIINLLTELQKQEGFAILFIAHDLALVRYLCQRILVMKDGRIIEDNDTEQIFAAPRETYTKTLLASILYPDPTRYR